MKIEFFKYPEVTPINEGVYLCVVFMPRYKVGNQYFYMYKEYNNNGFFHEAGEVVKSFTTVTAKQADENASI